MALSIYNTFERNISRAAVLAGKYANVRVWHGGLSGVSPAQDGNWILPAGPNSTNCSNTGMADGVWCSGLELAQHDDNSDGRSAFFNVLAVPWYFAEQLDELFASDGAGATPPPIGIMGNPVGGTMVEQWTPYEKQLACTRQACMCDGPSCNSSMPLPPGNNSACVHNAELWRGQQQPLVNTSILGWLWYQGENNCGGDAGNVLYGTGYGCMLPAMVAAWRSAWSATPGTTDPLAWFASVSLHDGGDEGDGNNAQSIRWAQAGNFGTLPSPDIPRSFIAEAYDGGDTWEGWVCYDTQGECHLPKPDTTHLRPLTLARSRPARPHPFPALHSAGWHAGQAVLRRPVRAAGQGLRWRPPGQHGQREHTVLHGRVPP